jgi:hypothetical protein
MVLLANVFIGILIIPLIFHKQSDLIFTLSVILSTLISFLYLKFLSKFSEAAEVYAHKAYSLAIGVSLLVFMMYFNNNIPAVPLSLKTAGVYHHLEKDSLGRYTALEVAPGNFFHKIIGYFTTDTYFFKTGEEAFFYSSVFAPNQLQAPLSHEWQFYDEDTKKWGTVFTVPFQVTGGRSGGYRGYSSITTSKSGLWRVLIKVGDKRLVGQKRFYLQRSDESQNLVPVEL